MVKVSVIVPNYNHALFLQQRIDSILHQTYQDFELILLDDCSTDNSRALIEEYRNHQQVSHIVFNTTNSGSTFKQWKKGIELAKGEFIWIAESDDIADDTFLEHVMALFNQYQHVGIINTNFTYIDAIGAKLPTDYNYHQFDKPVNGDDFVTQEMTCINKLYNASGIVFKKSLAVDAFDASILQMKYCGDWLFWTKLIGQTSIIITSKQLNFFRRHANNVSFKSEKAGLFIWEGFKIYRYILQHYRIHWQQKKKIEVEWAFRFLEINVTLIQMLKMCLHYPLPYLVVAYYLKNKLRKWKVFQL